MTYKYDERGVYIDTSIYVTYQIGRAQYKIKIEEFIFNNIQKNSTILVIGKNEIIKDLINKIINNNEDYNIISSNIEFNNYFNYFANVNIFNLYLDEFNTNKTNIIIVYDDITLNKYKNINFDYVFIFEQDKIQIKTIYEQCGQFISEDVFNNMLQQLTKNNNAITIVNKFTKHCSKITYYNTCIE